MKIFVTGGAGYIGSHVVQLMRERGHDVTVFDNLSQGHREAVPADVTFVQGDLLDEATLTDALRQTEATVVMHLAALALVGESMIVPERYFDVNVMGAHNLHKAMLACGVKQLIFSSTCATYGVPLSLPITEAMPTQPVNPYGASKLMFEQITEWYRQIHGVRAAVFRYFNAAGCWGELGEDHSPETHLIPNVLRAACGQLPHLEVYGTDYDTPDGTCIRDYVHVRDVASAHVIAAEGGVDGTFNLGSGKPASVREIIDIAREVTGREIPVKYQPRRPGDPPALYATGDQAAKVLGWKAAHSDVRSMVTQAWEWKQRFPNGYAGSA